MSTLRIFLNDERKEVIGMKQHFYAVARHGALLRALLVLTVIAAIAIVGGAPGGFGP